jgi:DNA invertase Pin-like site-specific DNA recombinase
MGSREPLRGVIYGRQSLTRDGSLSREDQEAAGRAEAGRHNIEVVATLIEPPSTGAYKNRGKNRPRWKELLDLVRNGKVQVVIAFKTDRLSRGGGPGWAPLIEAAEHAGLNPDRFVFIVGSGFMSEFEIGIRAAMDREESKKSGDRISQARARIAKEGKPMMGGPRPFGFRPDRVTHDEFEAELLRSAARRLLAGESMRGLVREWNAQGIGTSTGREWSAGKLTRILVGGRIAGLREYDTDESGGVGRNLNIIGAAAWEPILDQATWERIRARFLTGPHQAKPHASKFLLTGYLFCFRCGKPLYGDKPAPGKLNPGGVNWKISYRYYCRRRDSIQACGSNSILLEPTDEFVTQRVLEEFESRHFVARLRRANRAEINLEVKEAELIECENRLVELAAEFGDGKIPKREWMAMRKSAEARYQRALAAVTPLRQAVVLDDLGDLTTLRRRWYDEENPMGLNAKRAAIGAVVERIVVGPVVKYGRIDGRLEPPGGKIEMIS